MSKPAVPNESGRVPCLGGCGALVYPDQKCGECAALAVEESRRARERRRFSFLAKYHEDWDERPRGNECDADEVEG